MELDIQNMSIDEILELWTVLTEEEKELAVKRFYKENQIIEE